MEESEAVQEEEQPPYVVDPANIVQQQADLVRRVMAQITEMHLAIALRDAAIAQLRSQIAGSEASQELASSNGQAKGLVVLGPDGS